MIEIEQRLKAMRKTSKFLQAGGEVYGPYSRKRNNLFHPQDSLYTDSLINAILSVVANKISIKSVFKMLLCTTKSRHAQSHVLDSIFRNENI